MKYVSIFFFILLISKPVVAQQEKFIEVTGSAEMYIEPDEIMFNISIAEYWESEFENPSQKGPKRGEKVNILDIEKQLIKDLKKIGIKKEDISSTDVGTYWRSKNEEIRLRKSFEISLTDFSLINRIISEVNTLGIDYMRIGELKHKELSNYRVAVKKQALLAAKDKASYLAETLEKNIGDVISIRELNTQITFNPAFRANSASLESSSSAIDVEKKIQLQYQIIAKFEIVDN